MAWYGRSSRLIFRLLRRYNSKIPPLPSIPTSYSNPRIHHPTFSFYFNSLKNSNSNSNSITASAVSLNTLFSGSRISPSSIIRRSHSQFSSQRFFSLKTAPIQEEYRSGISHFSHPIYRNLVCQNSLKNSNPIFRDLFFVKESASQFPHPIFKNLVLHHPQEYVPLNLVSQNALKNNRSYFNGGAKRLNKWWNQNPRITIGLSGCGVAAASVYFWNLETIPYAKRTHFVPLSTYIEKKLSKPTLESEAEKYQWKILPSHHPHSVRVQKIGQEIVGALLNEEQSKKKMGTAADLEEFEWEFIVVDDPDYVYAECLPGGKIVVFAGLLDYFTTDAEIAAIIGHEVGHAAARHFAEIMYGIKCLTSLMFFVPDCVEKMTDPFVWLPYCRRREIEADYIGLLLMASAGYDPQVAIEVCEKFDRLYSTSPLDDEDDSPSTHPSEKRRAQLLSEPTVMEEALSLYREAVKEKKVEVGVEVKAEGEGDHAMGHMSLFNRLIGVFVKS